jgi:hypothetical protein
MASPDDPADPIGELDEMAASVAEMFASYCKAGIPAHHVAVMLGTWMGTMGGAGQPPGDG